jgi:hypothetical protein
MAKAGMVYAIVPGKSASYIIALHGSEPPTDDEWDGYMALGRGFFEQNPNGDMRGFTVTLGGGPTSKQRAVLAEFFKGRPSPLAAVVTESVIARGIVTAIRWLSGVQGRAFRFRDYGQALEYVGITAAESPRFLSELRVLSEGCSGNPIKQMLDAR